MQNKHNHHPSQEIIDSHAESRIMSDAELLSRGASIKDGQLYVTKSQIDEIQDRKHRQVGQMVLHDTLEVAASKSVEEMISIEEDRQQFEAFIKDTVNPYEMLFEDKVPSRTDNDMNWRGKLKDAAPLPSWRTERDFPHGARHYIFSGSYVPHSTFNALNEIEMGIFDDGDKAPGQPKACKLSMKLNYTDSALTSVRLKNKSRYGVEIADYTDSESKALEDFFHESNLKNGGQLNIRFDADEITMSGKANSRVHGFEYTFKPGTDLIYRGNTGKGSYPDSMPREYFLGILSGALSMIPTVHT